MSQAKDIAKELGAGGLAGCCGIILTQPLDTVRIRLQCSPPTNVARTSSLVKVAQEAILTEGSRGLFKGLVSPTIACGFINSVLFFSYGSAASVARNYTSDERKISFVAGMAAGIPTGLINAPAEHVKCRAQMNLRSTGTIKEEWIVFRNLLRSRQIFRGLGVTLVRDVPSYGCYFLSYSICLEFLKSHSDSFAMPLLAGGVAGMVSWAVTYPVDVLKTKWQTLDSPHITSSFKLAKMILREEGPGAFVKGLGATMLKAWPQSAIVFFVYDILTKEPTMSRSSQLNLL